MSTDLGGINVRELVSGAEELAIKLASNGELVGHVTKAYPVEVLEGRRVVAIEVGFNDYMRFISRGLRVGIGSILAILNPLTKCLFLGTVVGYKREDLLSILNVPILNPPKDPTTIQTPLILYVDLIAEGDLSSEGIVEGIRPPATPIEPNSPVFIPKPEVIMEMLGLPRDGVLVGYLRTGSDIRYDIGVKLPLDTLYHHVLVVGTTGSGKTVLLKNIATSVVREYGGLRPLVIALDLQGDYVRLPTEVSGINELTVLIPVTRGFLNILELSSNSSTEVVGEELVRRYVDLTFKDLISSYDVISVDSEFDELGSYEFIKSVSAEVITNYGSKFRIKLVTWSLVFSDVYSELSNFVPILSTQARIFITKLLSSYLSSVGGGSGVSIDSVCERLVLIEDIGRNLKVHKLTLENIIRCLALLKDTGLFDVRLGEYLRFREPNYSELFSSVDSVLVADIRFCRPPFTQSPYAESIFVYRLLDKLFSWKDSELKEGREPRPTVLLIDEAHNYFPQGGTELMSKGMVEEVINKLMRLGRVRKLGVVLATHQPSDLNRLAIQLSNTKIALRSDEETLKTIGLEKYYEDLRNAPAGYAVINTYLIKTQTLKIVTPEPPKMN